MKTAIQWEALAAVFNGECTDPINIAKILAAKISLTSDILKTYESNLERNDHFRSWFRSACSHRFSIHLPTEAPKIVTNSNLTTENYALAAYFGGSKIIADTSKLKLQTQNTLQALGINITSINQKITEEDYGDTIFEKIHLSNYGSIDFSIFDRYLKIEEDIVIYDKYINGISIQLLEHIAKTMQAGSNLYIYHTHRTGGNLLDSSTISSCLTAANPTINIVCKKCSQNFSKKIHDRYIFLGNRIQIELTVGLACFGGLNAFGKRVNRKSSITISDSSAGEDLVIEAADLSTITVRCVK